MSISHFNINFSFKCFLLCDQSRWFFSLLPLLRLQWLHQRSHTAPENIWVVSKYLLTLISILTYIFKMNSAFSWLTHAYSQRFNWVEYLLRVNWASGWIFILPPGPAQPWLPGRNCVVWCVGILLSQLIADFYFYILLILFASPRFMDSYGCYWHFQDEECFPQIKGVLLEPETHCLERNAIFTHIHLKGYICEGGWQTEEPDLRARGEAL